MANNQEESPLVKQQQLQAQIQAINTERATNIEMARRDFGYQDQVTEAMNNAAMMATMNNQGLAPSTAQVLGKYAKGPIQSRSVKTTPSKIEITNNNTTNNVVHGGGGDGGTQKFKAWLNTTLSMQRDHNKSRMREFDRREGVLSRTVNKMMHKLGNATQAVAENMNPQNIGNTLGGQIKTLLFIFGATFLAKHFGTVLDVAHKIYNGVLDIGGFFGVGPKAVEMDRSGKSLKTSFISFFGGNPRKDNVLGLFKTMFTELMEHAGLWFEWQMKRRGVAARSIKFPDIDWGGNGEKINFMGIDLGPMIAGLGRVFGNAFQGVTTYLGDVLTAVVSPEAGLQRAMSSQMGKVASKTTQSAQHREWSEGRHNEFTNEGDHNMGDKALLTNGAKRQYTMQSGALGFDGRLKNTVGAQVSQARDILGALNDARDYGHVDQARVVKGLERLQEASRSNGGVIVDEEFVKRLYGKTTGIPGMKEVRMKLVSEAMSGENQDLENVYSTYVHGANGFVDGAAGGLTAEAGGLWGRAKAAKNEFKKGNYVKGVSKFLSPGTTGIVEGIISESEKRDKRYTLVPTDDPRNGTPVTTHRFYQLSPEALQYLAKTGFNVESFDSSNASNVLPAVQNRIVQQAGGQTIVNRKWTSVGRSKFEKQYSTDLSEYRSQLQELENVNKSYQARLDGSAWSQRTNVIAANVGNAVNSVGSFLAGNSGSFGPVGTPTMKYTSQQVRNISNHLMKTLLADKDLNLTPEQAAGIVGNLLVESANYSAVSKSHADGKNGAQSIGLAQWNSNGQPDIYKPGTNTGKLFAWCKANNLDPFSIDGQAQFLLYTLKSGNFYPHGSQFMRALQGTSNDPASVASLFMKIYERPAPASSAEGRRRGNAELVLREYMGAVNGGENLDFGSQFSSSGVSVSGGTSMTGGGGVSYDTSTFSGAIGSVGNYIQQAVPYVSQAEVEAKNRQAALRAEAGELWQRSQNLINLKGQRRVHNYHGGNGVKFTAEQFMDEYARNKNFREQVNRDIPGIEKVQELLQPYSESIREKFDLFGINSERGFEKYYSNLSEKDKEGVNNLFGRLNEFSSKYKDSFSVGEEHKIVDEDLKRLVKLMREDPEYKKMELGISTGVDPKYYKKRQNKLFNRFLLEAVQGKHGEDMANYVLQGRGTGELTKQLEELKNQLKENTKNLEDSNANDLDNRRRYEVNDTLLNSQISKLEKKIAIRKDVNGKMFMGGKLKVEKGDTAATIARKLKGQDELYSIMEKIAELEDDLSMTSNGVAKFQEEEVLKLFGRRLVTVGPDGKLIEKKYSEEDKKKFEEGIMEEYRKRKGQLSDEEGKLEKTMARLGLDVNDPKLKAELQQHKNFIVDGGEIGIADYIHRNFRKDSVGPNGEAMTTFNPGVNFEQIVKAVSDRYGAERAEEFLSIPDNRKQFDPSFLASVHSEEVKNASSDWILNPDGSVKRKTGQDYLNDHATLKKAMEEDVLSGKIKKEDTMIELGTGQKVSLLDMTPYEYATFMTAKALGADAKNLSMAEEILRNLGERMSNERKDGSMLLKEAVTGVKELCQLGKVNSATTTAAYNTMSGELSNLTSLFRGSTGIFTAMSDNLAKMSNKSDDTPIMMKPYNSGNVVNAVTNTAFPGQASWTKK